MAQEIEKVTSSLSRLVDRHGPLVVITFILLGAVLLDGYSSRARQYDQQERIYNQQERIIGALQEVAKSNQEVTKSNQATTAQLGRLTIRIENLERRSK